MSHSSYEAWGVYKQTMTHRNTEFLTHNTHSSGREWDEGKACRVTFTTKMLNFLSSCWVHLFLNNEQQFHANGGKLVLEMLNFFKAHPLLGNI